MGHISCKTTHSLKYLIEIINSVQKSKFGGINLSQNQDLASHTDHIVFTNFIRRCDDEQFNTSTSIHKIDLFTELMPLVFIIFTVYSQKLFAIMASNHMDLMATYDSISFFFFFDFPQE